MSESDTYWLELLKHGQDRAAAELWERYFNRLLLLARKKLSTGPRRIADEEDVAISAFHSFCRGAGKKQFDRLEDRGDLWQVLAMITARKAIRQTQRERAKKRGGDQVHGESIFLQFENTDAPAGIAQLASEGPDPQFQSIVDEEFSRLLDQLESQDLREIALWKLEGFTNDEIAEKIGRNVRTVERKLNLIRMQWSQETDES